MVTSPETVEVETPDQWGAGGGGRSQSGGGCFYHSWHEGLCCLDLGGWWWILRGVSRGEGDSGVSALLLTRHIVVRYSRFGVSLGKNSWLFVTNLSGRDTLDKDRPCLSSGGQWTVTSNNDHVSRKYRHRYFTRLSPGIWSHCFQSRHLPWEMRLSAHATSDTYIWRIYLFILIVLYSLYSSQ